MAAKPKITPPTEPTPEHEMTTSEAEAHARTLVTDPTPVAKAPKAAKVAHACACTASLEANPALAEVGFVACDATTKGIWAPGHDARFHGAQSRLAKKAAAEA